MSAIDQILLVLILIEFVLIVIWIILKVPLTFRLCVEIATQIDLRLTGTYFPFDWDYVLHGKQLSATDFHP